MKKEYIKIKLSDLKLNTKNPRKNDASVKFVKNSIDKVGYVSPIVVDETNTILAGNTRAKALKQRGDTEIEVIRVSGLTDEQKKIYMLADNSAGSKSEWDFGLIKDLEIPKLELQDIGFDEIDLMKVFPILDSEKDNQIPEAPEDAKTKMGDIYELGNHRVMCGDSTKREDVERLMGGKKADIVFTSPPYNFGKSSNISGNHNVKLKKIYIVNMKI
jgi:site-specific DNA-methyltransferase (adenine-specific)